MMYGIPSPRETVPTFLVKNMEVQLGDLLYARQFPIREDDSGEIVEECVDKGEGKWEIVRGEVEEVVYSAAPSRDMACSVKLRYMIPLHRRNGRVQMIEQEDVFMSWEVFKTQKEALTSSRYLNLYGTGLY